MCITYNCIALKWLKNNRNGTIMLLWCVMLYSAALLYMYVSNCSNQLECVLVRKDSVVITV